MTPRNPMQIHQEVWLVLPFLANGRLAQPLRWRAERHVALCAECRQELALQRRLCEALAAPEAVSHTPSASLARLLRRSEPARPVRRTARPSTQWARRGWRAAGLASSAACLLALGFAAHSALEPAYRVHSDAPAPDHAPLLHIAFARDVTIGEVAQVLHRARAEVREGPSEAGILGIGPLGAGDTARLTQLAAQLRAEPQVRWVEPLPQAAGPAPNP